MRDKLLSVGKLIVGIIIIFTVTLITTGIGSGLSEQVSIPFFLEASQFVGFILGSAAAMYAFDVPIEKHKPTKEELKLGGAVLFTSLLLSVTLSVLVSLFNITPPQNTVTETLRSGSQLVVVGFILLNFLFVGPAEELVFRGYIQGQLKESMTARASIIGSSGLFAIAHFPAMGSGELLSMSLYLVILLAIGGLLGVTYEKTENLVIPILIHACYNSVSAVPFLFG